MSQYRKGYFTSAGSAVSLNLGFVPDKMIVTNYTTASTDVGAVLQSLYYNGLTPIAGAAQITRTVTTGALTEAAITTNGFTPVVLGGDWQNTNYAITGITAANPGVVTVSSVSPTNSLTLVNGMTFTISGIPSSSNLAYLNTQRFIVAGISGTSFKLYDTYGNPVDTSAFTTYSGAADLNVISYPPTAPVLNATTGQVVTPGQPAGNQYDIGYEGITLGTSVVGSSTNVIFWEAFKETPTGW